VSSPAKTAGYEKEEEDRVKGLLVLFIAFGLILIVGTLAFRADGGATRAALLLLALAMFLMTMVWFGWVNRYLSGVARGTTLGILALVVALIALLPVLYLGEDERIYFLKLAAIVFLSLLPGLLYLQFVVVKGLGLRSEYILALHRLHIDRYENLPTPPVGSLFHRPGPHPHGGDVENFYIRKFDSYYGRPITRPDGMVVQAGGNLLPVLIATIVIATGWTLVIQPEFIPGIHLELGGLQLAGTPVLPSEALRYAFLGAYFYSLEMLTRRYFQEDLKPSAYLNAVTRILGSALLVIAVDALWPGELTSAQENGLAFVIGVFPQIGMKAIQNLIALPLRPLIPSLVRDYPLSDLDGLNVWYESRLLEVGIEDMQNLATANLVDAILKTRVPVDRLVDWVDQAHLFLRVRDIEDGPKDRTALRRLGIRTATDLEDAFEPGYAPGVFGSAPATAGESKEFLEQLRRVLNTEGDGLPSITESVRRTFSREPNLYHVRQWKSYAWDLEQDERREASEPVRVGEAAPDRSKARS